LGSKSADFLQPEAFILLVDESLIFDRIAADDDDDDEEEEDDGGDDISAGAELICHILLLLEHMGPKLLWSDESLMLSTIFF
jgi:hypothetical protein